MGNRNRWALWLAVAALVGLVGTILDPLEGSVVAVAAAGLLSVAAYLRRSALRRRIYIAFALVVVGVAIMFILSDMGGVGGNSGRSGWLGLLILPYPVGWLMGLILAVRLVRVERLANQ